MRSRSSSALTIATLACACGPIGSSAPPPPPPTEPMALREVVFHGMCDASGAIALSSTVMLAADDEDNVLRAYDTERGGPPMSSADVSPALGLPLKGKKRPHHPEVDLEAATLLDGRAYWMSSHARNAKGKLKEERFVFFATTATADVEVLGQYDGLLDDLIADPRYARFDLAAASELAPKEAGGLNLEGLTATTDGAMFIGFRNPIPNGRAVIAPLENGPALVTGEASAAELGDPIELDLGGQGVRSMSWWHGRYLILAGDFAEGGASRLYSWDGVHAPTIVELDLSGYNPEGFFSPEDRDEILLLSDDGSVTIDGEACKELDDPTQKRFRGVWVTIPS